MSDLMTFPKTVDEFMETYKIVDTEEVYTNGDELVPIFRMKQWFEAHEAIPIEWVKEWAMKSENTYNREQIVEMLNDWGERK